MNTWESNKKAEKILKDVLEKASKDKQVNIRLTDEQYNEIEKRMKKYNFTSISEYLRFVGTNAQVKVDIGDK
jgi:hypothetical protein